MTYTECGVESLEKAKKKKGKHNCSMFMTLSYLKVTVIPIETKANIMCALTLKNHIWKLFSRNVMFAKGIKIDKCEYIYIHYHVVALAIIASDVRFFFSFVS